MTFSNLLKVSAFLSVSFILAACSGDEDTAVVASGQHGSSPEIQVENSNAQIEAIADEVWRWNLESNYIARVQRGLPIVVIKDITPEQIEADAIRAESYITRLNSIEKTSLDHDHAITRAFLLRFLKDIKLVSQTDELIFAVTPYNGGFSFTYLFQYAAGAPVESAPQREDYLTFLRELSDLIEQMGAKTLRQASADVRLPKAALPGVVALYSNLKAGSAALIPVSERLEGVAADEADAFLADTQAIVEGEIIPAYQRIIDIFDEAYEKAAPAIVGLAQYPGGSEVYEKLIERYVQHPYTAKQVHEFGLAQMAELNRQMAEVRAEIGFEGTQAEFHEFLRTDPRFLAKSPADVEARYQLYIERIEPLISDYFSFLPNAPYGVQRLDPANEPGQTFGYYQLPTPNEPRGLYRYNGSNLASRSLVGAGSLIYHELIPGHHFHLATQQENETLPEIRRSLVSLSLGGFNEGWAEYAAGLGYEMGLYDDPYDRYGRLVMSAFLASRLVVDTGLNALGWSLEQARTYQLDNTMMSELEVNSESLRYSTDIPGQALGYHLGRAKFDALRKKAEDSLSDDFDIKEFHAAILGQGALPLDVLEDHIDWYIEQYKK